MSKKQATGRYHKKSARIGFHEWNLNAWNEFRDKLDDLLSQIMKEGMEIAITEYKCNAWFPIEWGDSDGVGGKTPDDPTMIYVELPIGPSDEENPRWSFHLSDLVDSIIDLHEEGEQGPLGSKGRKSAVAVRDSLRRLADQLDAALSRS